MSIASVMRNVRSADHMSAAGSRAGTTDGRGDPHGVNVLGDVGGPDGVSPAEKGDGRGRKRPRQARWGIILAGQGAGKRFPRHADADRASQGSESLESRQ